ncbi:MAG: N5-glutamine methyltransferase family protein, partial [Alkalispirochaeta sp.]
MGRLRELVARSLSTSDSPALDALILLETASSRSREDLLAEFRTPATRLLSAATLDRLSSLVERRRRGDPIAYITGTKEFFGYEFAVGPGVLVPRPETEHLVDEGLRLLARHSHAVIHDAFTGTGCVGITLARERAARGATTRLMLSDHDPTAIVWAERNAARLLQGIAEINYSVERADVL